jgi:hypothetical protein
MAPASTFGNVSDGRFGDSEMSGYGVAILSKRQPGSDFLGLLRDQFCATVAFAAVGSPVRLLVALVVLVRVISKVCESVVASVAVAVADLHAVWARACERLHNDAVNQERLWSVAIAAEVDIAVPVMANARGQGLGDLPSCFLWRPETQHRSVVAGYVVWVAWDGFGQGRA